MNIKIWFDAMKKLVRLKGVKVTNNLILYFVQA